ncbi:unnamed protein product [Prorocentrum cordatum]|uniref:PAP-associated domain-containing protein n=1 Tax=Prorocentrum cordatum TaxID=2364126 RepID=A0ABN9SYZ4_9DINO|nr:unnamed protein product [Polarella glacialis]
MSRGRSPSPQATLSASSRGTSPEPYYGPVDAPPPLLIDLSPLAQQWKAAPVLPQVMYQLVNVRTIACAKCSASDLADLDVVHKLAAAPERQRWLKKAAQLSLVAFMTPAGGNRERLKSELGGSMAPMPGLSTPGCAEDWPRNYVLTGSDVNIFVQGGLDSAVKKMQLNDKINGLKLLQRKRLQNLDVLQCTFSCNSVDVKHVPEVQSEIIVVSTDDEMKCLKGRQEAFRKVFRDQRVQLEVSFGDAGMLAFDAYIYLLKAFAKTMPEGALSSFQAVSFGLFVLQLGLYKHVPGTAAQPTALLLFECFLRWCGVYFSNQWNSDQKLKNHRFSALDLSTGRLMLRTRSQTKCEAYFVADEVHSLHTHSADRLNIAGSISPKLVHDAAHLALVSHLSVANGELVCR